VSLFNFNLEEILTFFAVMVRYSVLFSVLPFVGDRVIPSPVKILLALTVSIAMFPSLVASGQVHPGDARIWGATAGGIVRTVGLEMVFGLALGYSAKLVFDSIALGGNLIGNFMGFASASSFDPHQESQTEVIAQVQTTLAMLIFLCLDGHHLMLRATLDSFRIVGLGKAELSGAFSQKLIQMTGDVITFGLQIAAPMAVSLFSVNVVFGVLSKAMPQLNIFMLSFSITTIAGFTVLLLNLPGFHDTVTTIFGRMGDVMNSTMLTLASGR
jgi:flagellar biosynthetic protein FliR